MSIFSLNKNFLLLLLLMFGFSVEGYSMSFFGIGKIFLFSETSGQVVFNDKPVEGALLTRSVIWQNKTFKENSTTDKNGNFHFDAKVTNSLSKFMPVEAVMTQKILIQNNGKEFEGWKTNKRDYEENSELNGKPLVLICDLSHESIVKEEGTQVIKGICKWK